MDPFQIVAEPKRREILRLIWDSELAAGEIADRFEVTFGAVSQHLAVLREAGYVTVRPQGNRRLYSADKEALGALADALQAMWASTLDQLAETVQEAEG